MNWLVLTRIFRKKILTNKILEFKCENSGISHPVNIKVTKRKKTISIRIDKNKILVNTPNFIKEDYILRLLERKKEWISRTILKNSKQYNNNFINREAFYLGKKYKINIKKGLSNEVIFKNDNLAIFYKRKNINIIRDKFDENGGYQAAKKILSTQEKPTAIFAANDLIAMGQKSGPELGQKLNYLKHH